MSIASVAGHSEGSPGASGSGLREHVVTRQLNAAFIGLTGAIDCTSDARTQNEVLVEQVRRANASGASLAVAWHLNGWDTPVPSGGEVFYMTGDADGKEYAERVSAAISGLLGIPNRGAKATTALWWITETDMTAILIEPGFISNPNDARLIMAHIEDIARVTAVSLGAYVPAVVPKPAPAPTFFVGMAHAASRDAVGVYQAWADSEGFELAPVACGVEKNGALSFTDGLAYVANGKRVVDVFGRGNETAVLALHGKGSRREAFAAFAESNGDAHLERACGEGPIGHPDHASALFAILNDGVGVNAVFGAA